MQPAQLTFDSSLNQYVCRGDWSTLHMDAIVEDLETLKLKKVKALVVNGAQLEHFDSAGALVLLKCIDSLKTDHQQHSLTGFTQQQLDLIDLVSKKKTNIHYSPPEPPNRDILYQIGEESVHKLHQANGLVILIGDLSCKLFSMLKYRRRVQWPSIVSNMASTGLYALPIIALLSFLIGVVLAYQMGLQLETYGANIFIAYLSGMAIFREFGPLITAIIVAGRTSSSFTAQIGSMKINEEIDVLYTMGLSPTELLVMPKVIGLLFMFPLLIFWADFFATLGAMLMSKFMLSIGYADFLIRLQDSVGLKQMMLGLYKAPAFAILIALVGCFQGFQVGTSADSVGSQTTRAVVQALFLIIVTDATFSVIYSWLGL